MSDKILIVNYKAYIHAFTQNGITIAEAARKLRAKLSSTRIILAVPSPLLYKILEVYDDVYLQHVDPVSPGSHTGFLPAKALEYLPVKGTLVNHSEHKLVYRSITQIIDDVRSVGKEVVACADTPGEAAGLAYIRPTMIAVEPPELIGTGIPVSKAKPEIITNGVKAVHSIDPSIPVLAGAGITSGEDAVKSLELGASGVLVASAIVKAKDPAGKLEELAIAMDTF
ncbi:MAG: triose-phosphate isomerase [Desulfurococcales archaeon]|nr:triose-phosphate isomerase [Desulfurococcales archaeon]